MESARNLTLPEQLLLLALHDEKGTVQTWMFSYAIAGAILAELQRRGLIAVEAMGDRRVVRAGGVEPTGDALLDECLLQITSGAEPQTLAAWIGRFAALKELKDRVAEPLCRRGVLTRSADRVLWVFPRVLYPTADVAPEQQLIQDLRRGIEEDGDVEPRVAAVLALAHAAEMLEANFERALLKARRARLEALVQRDETALATREAIELAQAAVAMAVGTSVG